MIIAYFKLFQLMLLFKVFHTQQIQKYTFLLHKQTLALCNCFRQSNH